MRIARLLGSIALVVVLRPGASDAQGVPVEIVFLDVGQGDAIVVRAPDGQTALIDAGPGQDLTHRLRELGVDQLDLVVATHPHADHIGGMLGVIESVPIRFYMDNGRTHTTATYLGVMRALERRPEIGYLQAVPRTISLGSVRIQVLPMPPPSSNPNDNSVGLLLVLGDFRAMLTGDAERDELEHFVRTGSVPEVTLLKAPHHGSDDAVSPSFLERARPEVVVISVGRGNSYGHPSPEALTAYSGYAAGLYRTDLHSRVIVRGYEDGSYDVTLGEPATTEGGPSEDAAIAIRVFADAPGNDHRNTNGEYAVLTNGSGATIEIAGWTLCDAARHCYTFPSGASIPPGGTSVLHTGLGRTDGTRYFMGSGSAVWNNDGDTATLYDQAGRVVARHVY